ncbi:MAG: type III pantothenate kinase [Candidatus Kapaibacterium sp.]
MSNPTGIAIDIGNTRCKLLYDGTLYIVDYSDDWATHVLEHIQAINVVTTCGISSVSAVRSEALTQLLTDNGIAVITITPGLIQQHITTSGVIGTGTDRLLGVIGGINVTQSPLITVDFGTAVTVNAVDRNNNFLGGTIMPGVRTQLQALHTHTAQLPLVERSDCPLVLGTTTTHAILAGVVYGVAGAVQNIVATMQQQNALLQHAAIIFCGGDASFMIDYFPAQFAILRPHLVLEGILRITNTNT